jgi:hypothetical protein
MFRSFSSGFSWDRERGARRRKKTFSGGLEPLEGRDLLSTAGIAELGAPGQGPVLADFSTQFVQEGNSLTLQARATDPNGRSLIYSLDPGAPAGATIDPTSGLFTWTPPNLQHIYNLSIRVTEDGAPSLGDATTLTVMVFDVSPNVQAGVNATIDRGTALVRTGSFGDPNPDTWSATVDYGDGSGVQALALNPDRTFALNHAYTTSGNYTVAVTIDDSQGGQGRGFFAVQVQQASTPTQPPSPAGTSQGQSTTGTGTSTGGSAQQQNSLHPPKHGPQRRARPKPHFIRGPKQH